MKKDMLDLVNALVDAGYTVELTSKHTKVRGGNEMVIMPRTPSDPRALRNALAQLRRSGYKFTYKGREYKQ